MAADMNALFPKMPLAASLSAAPGQHNAIVSPAQRRAVCGAIQQDRPTCGCAGRRRRDCGPCPGDRTASGFRPIVLRRHRRSRACLPAKPCNRRRARNCDCRSGATAACNHRGVGNAPGATDPGHGSHGQHAYRFGAADISYIRRRGRAGRAVRTYGGERAPARRAADEGKGRGGRALSAGGCGVFKPLSFPACRCRDGGR